MGIEDVPTRSAVPSSVRSIPLSPSVPRSDGPGGISPVFELLPSSSEISRQANNENVKTGMKILLVMRTAFTSQKGFSWQIFELFRAMTQSK